jgi:hypothetical protein
MSGTGGEAAARIVDYGVRSPQMSNIRGKSFAGRRTEIANVRLHLRHLAAEIINSMLTTVPSGDRGSA